MPYAFSHRHYSHLLAIYPLYLLNTEQTGAVDIIEKSLAFWQSKPKALQGYSCTGASSISSAIGKGNDALAYLNKLFGKFLSPTTMYKEAGPVIETPLSGAQCIHDMLLQSWGGKIRIFPAVPDAWQDVAYSGLRTEGAFKVSASRKLKNIFFICICALFAFTGCTDDDDELLANGDTNINLLPNPQPNGVINEKLFEVINLDYPGLEKVKEYYEANEYYYAAHELLKYYRNRSDVSNPNINLINPSITAFDQNIADQALEHRFYVRNFKEKEENGKEVYYLFDKDKKIDWTYIPAEITDQEFKSQTHRHQWMLPQAKAYRVNQNEKYIQSWIEVYSDWLNTFPCPEGTVSKDAVQWYGLQPAERVLDQIDIMPHFIQSTNFTPQWLSTFLVAFANEVECIRNNYYTDGSNIYVTQVQAITTAGILMPEFKNAEAWLNEGAQKITEQITAQFLEDGVQNELDPSYHIGVVAGFYNIYKIAQLNNKLSLFPSTYIEQLRKAARFVMDIIYPDYTIDNFNDTRSASYTKNVLLRNLRQYSEMFPDDAEMKWISTEGKQGTTPAGLTQIYDASEGYMLRSGWGKSSTMMILKNNNNPDNKWHCQPDNGTFGIYRNGRNFFPDAGVYSYGGTSASNEDRKTFLATKNHNTMTALSATIANGYMKGEFLKHREPKETHRFWLLRIKLKPVLLTVGLYSL